MVLLASILRLKHGVPNHDAFSRVFRQFDLKPFPSCIQIVVQKGDCVIALKGNDGTLQADIRLVLEDPDRLL